MSTPRWYRGRRVSRQVVVIALLCVAIGFAMRTTRHAYDARIRADERATVLAEGRAIDSLLFTARWRRVVDSLYGIVSECAR